MADTSLADLSTAIFTALNANLGTFDLSGTDAVKEGTYTSPPGGVVPFASISPPDVTSVPQARDRWFLRTCEYTIRLWAPFTADSPSNRASVARAFMSEAMTALETAHRSTTILWRCVSFVIAAATPDPATANVPPGFAYATLTLELSYRRTAGLGG